MIHLERDVVDANDLFAAGRVDLEDGLVGAGKLQLGRAAMVAGPGQQLESQLLEERHRLVHIADDQLDMIDAPDHGFTPYRGTRWWAAPVAEGREALTGAAFPATDGRRKAARRLPDDYRPSTATMLADELLCRIALSSA